MTIVLLLSSILLMPFLSQAQEKEAPPAKTATAPRNSDRQDARQCACQLSEAERLELEKDVEKMRTLIGQMQYNLAAAATGDTPVKRQFQMDIEMWQLLLQRMESRLEGSAKK